jgi:hypothetical protein
MFADLRHTAKFPQRRLPRFRLGHATFYVFGYREIEMGVQLVFEVLV